MRHVKEWQLDSIAVIVRTLCGVRCVNPEDLPKGPKIFYANHTSHLDFMAIWSTLPHYERLHVRPVAGRDYWIRSRARRFVAEEVFNALLIERSRVTRDNNPLTRMLEVLDSGASLIVFPEGTRGTSREPAPFKPGLFHLHKERPEVPLVPVYLDNFNCMLPKGAVLPVPLITHMAIGKPVPDLPREKGPFLTAARQAILDFIKE